MLISYRIYIALRFICITSVSGDYLELRKTELKYHNKHSIKESNQLSHNLERVYASHPLNSTQDIRGNDFIQPPTNKSYSRVNSKIGSELHEQPSYLQGTKWHQSSNKNMSEPTYKKSTVISNDENKWIKFLKPLLKYSLANHTMKHHEPLESNFSMKSNPFFPSNNLHPNLSIPNFSLNETDMRAYLSMIHPFRRMQYEYPPWENLTYNEQTRFLELELGPTNRYNKTMSAFLTTYYGSLLMVGVPGNGLTCLIILTNSYMRTAPNIFLFNLAVVDLVTLTMSKFIDILFKDYYRVRYCTKVFLHFQIFIF